MVGEEPEVDDLGGLLGVGREFRIADSRLAVEEELPGLHSGGGQISTPIVIAPLEPVAPVPPVADGLVVVAIQRRDRREDETHGEPRHLPGRSQLVGGGELEAGDGDLYATHDQTPPMIRSICLRWTKSCPAISDNINRRDSRPRSTCCPARSRSVGVRARRSRRFRRRITTSSSRTSSKGAS